MLLFVYGTLLRGEENARRLQHAAFVCEDRTQPCNTLVNLGPYPGLLATGNTSVCGELFDIDEQRLAALDAFEEHPEVYERSSILLASGFCACTYLLRAEYAVGATILADGNWRLRPRIVDGKGGRG